MKPYWEKGVGNVVNATVHLSLPPPLNMQLSAYARGSEPMHRKDKEGSQGEKSAGIG